MKKNYSGKTMKNSVLLLLPLLLPACTGISFQLPPLGRKCLKDEIHQGVLVTGVYHTEEGGPTDLKVTDSSGHILYSKEDAKKGKFAFSTDEYEIYEICFERRKETGQKQVSDQLITLDIKHGVEAKNLEDLAKTEKLKPMEVLLRRLELLSESLVKDFSYMKTREEKMSDTTESTSARVLYFSMFSMLCLVVLATSQVFYLRFFFKSKKLIQ